jgi:hypothetical protein
LILVQQQSAAAKCSSRILRIKAARPGRSRRRLGALRLRSRWRCRSGGASAGRLARKRWCGPQKASVSHGLVLRHRRWLPLRHCPGRPEPVKGAFGVGSAADP